ncbi:MAG: 23S rRNA (uracil(1939)-C(5))-methyltransferase RlmD [Deltaproteobacteria bacterium]|jgi:23S rRNA (uracil1939-C5)-methyltransferase|nr:23S rRNA (uracil(1939)-C(5))-methyltransferase RlmD [Deltaproteobacteria bacterium]
MATDIKTGKKLLVKIDDLDSEWRGIAVINGMECIVPGLYPGDQAVVEVVAVSQHHPRCFCEFTQLQSSGNNRITARCGIYPQCSGCPGIALKYKSGVAWKKAKVEAVFQRKVKFYHSPKILGYRSKTKLVAGRDNHGKKIFGGYQKGTHSLMPLDHCPVVNQNLQELYHPLQFVIRQLEPYDELQETGFVRSVFLKTNSAGEIHLTFVVFRELSKLEKDIFLQLSEINSVKGININLHTQKTNRLVGEREYTIFGKEYLIESNSVVDYAVNSTGFSQINLEIAEKAYGKIVDWAGTESEKILDLFCGNGPIALALAKKGHTVTGVEREGLAVKLAKSIGATVDFIEMDARNPNFISEFIHKEKFGVIVLNPPRSGLKDELCKSINQSTVKNLIYMSCSVFSLNRDIERLKESGFKIIKMVGFDMFPHTPHFETLVHLQR